MCNNLIERKLLLPSRNTRKLRNLARFNNPINEYARKSRCGFRKRCSLCGNRDCFPSQNSEFCLTNAIYRTVNYLLHSRSLPCRQHPRLSSNVIGFLLLVSARLSSSFFNGVHPLPIRIIIHPLRTASFYAIHFGGLRPCSTSPKITVVGIIDRRCFATERFSVNGLGKLGRFVRSCKMKFRDDGQMKRQGNYVKKMKYYFERELRTSHSF